MRKMREPKKPCRKKFAKFLKAQQGKTLDLASFYPYCRLLTAALAEEKRWAIKARICRSQGSRKGQTLTDSVLEHTGVDIPLLGAQMLAMEIGNGTADGLDPALLHLAFTVHDWAEAIGKGDVCSIYKTTSDEDQECDNFDLLISVFPPETRAYFRKAFDMSGEASRAIRTKTIPLSSVSKNGRFFRAVETAAFLLKALFEVRNGKKAFVNAFIEDAPSILLFREFFSFRYFIDPYLAEICQMMADHPYYKDPDKTE